MATMTEQTALSPRGNGNNGLASHPIGAPSSTPKRTPSRPSSPRAGPAAHSTPTKQRGGRKHKPPIANGFLQLLGAAESSLPYADDRAVPDPP